MDYEVILERYELAKTRILQIRTEKSVEEPFLSYFRKMADFVEKLDKAKIFLEEDKEREKSLEEWQSLNRSLYEDILPEYYENSYGNPRYCEQILGKAFGHSFCFLYSELRSGIGLMFEGRLEEVDILLELLLEIYGLFEKGEGNPSTIKETIYWYASDYCDVFVAEGMKRQVDDKADFFVNLVSQSNLSDFRYLYKSGEFVGRSQWELAALLNQLSEEERIKMATVYTEGYRRGFINGGKDLSKKDRVSIYYPLGFEHVVKIAMEQFQKMGLKTVIFRTGEGVLMKGRGRRVGLLGGVPNRQYQYDHKDDQALFLDGKFLKRKLEVIEHTFEEVKEEAAGMAGPACIEIFGEEPFVPEQKKERTVLSKKQEGLVREGMRKQSQIVNRYIKGEERSFTIVAYPTYEIGENYPEIFREIIKINTLDAKLYEEVQQKLIDVLDQGKMVWIRGKGKNETNLRVALKELKNPESETKFENCVADVNIPVGEVFTTPVLKGTTGLLHVGKVYLEGLQFENLKIWFEDGRITDYGCTNFEEEEENRAYIFQHIFQRQEALPMGEFAIGTNTQAFALSKKYDIAQKLPILIAEKMGPHFAVGDTCYTWSEDIPVYNPNGKEIVARDNEISIQRKEDVGKAYFQCHTDITIPYDELDSILVLSEDKEIPLIQDGKFVVEGTEILNEPLKNTYK